MIKKRICLRILLVVLGVGLLQFDVRVCRAQNSEQVIGGIFDLLKNAHKKKKAIHDLDHHTATYSVGGIRLGTQGSLDKNYSCSPSKNFSGFDLCTATTQEHEARGSFGQKTTVLKASNDSRVAYVSRFLDPAFFAPNEINNDIDDLTKKFDSFPTILLMPKRPNLPDAVIATWGDLKLSRLNSNEVDELLKANEARGEIFVDYLHNFTDSQKYDLPIYRIAGNSGFVWVATFKPNGTGLLRFLAIDASSLNGKSSFAPASELLDIQKLPGRVSVGDSRQTAPINSTEDHSREEGNSQEEPKYKATTLKERQEAAREFFDQKRREGVELERIRRQREAAERERIAQQEREAAERQAAVAQQQREAAERQQKEEAEKAAQLAEEKKRADEQKEQEAKEKSEADKKERRSAALQKGPPYAANSNTTWNAQETKNEMTDRVEVSVTSTQSNDNGAVATVKGFCAAKGTIDFTAQFVDTNGLPLDLANPKGGVIGDLRINDEPTSKKILTSVDYSNVLLIAELRSEQPNKVASNLEIYAAVMTLGMANLSLPIDEVWRVMAEVKTSQGPVLVKIPVFDDAIQKMVKTCQ